MNTPELASIKGTTQNYAWGGKCFIADLLGIANHANIPFAELWLGAHYKASAIVKENAQRLNELISVAPKQLLGISVATRFNRELPYLLKILDVEQMLSIQVHPTKAGAISGYRYENTKRIPLNAAHRNYKDKNHKPELMVALSDFWLLHGFVSPDKLAGECERREELSFMVNFLQQKKNYELLYKYLMNLPQKTTDKILMPLLSRIVPLYKKGKLARSNPDFWAARAALTLSSTTGKCDKGIFSIYLFNLLKLKKGQGVFQAPMVPHAYLEGVSIELMANSDNVLRGGLTPKHIDTGELIKNIVFEACTPQILTGKYITETEKLYAVPSYPDFILSKIVTSRLHSHHNTTHSLAIFIVLEGNNVWVKTSKKSLLVNKGESFIIVANKDYSITSEQPACLFKADVPE